MELPKPPGLERPMQVRTNDLAKDRMNAGSASGSGTDFSACELVGSMPSEDINEQKDSKIADLTRKKLRRSRSASELQELCALKSTSYVAGLEHSRCTSVNELSATGADQIDSNSNKMLEPNSGTVPGKHMPTYDFKSKYNNLLAKHKVLKAKYKEKCKQLDDLHGIPKQFGETDQKAEAGEQLRAMQTERENFNRKIESANMKIAIISNYLVSNKEKLKETTDAYNILKEEDEKLHELADRLTEEKSKLQKDVELFKDQLFQANLERREMHNTIMNLRGNIRVFCRVRPPLELEKDKALCSWNYVDDTSVEVAQKNRNLTNVFTFDQVFHPAAKQEDIFEMVEPLVQSALDGYNVCIFAYGQTGSGKTYTMEGIQSQAGVIPRTIDFLFAAIENYKRLGWEYEIKVTFLEIYNEVLYDLLSNEQKEMEIRMVKDNKEDVYVSNITEEIVVTASRLTELMQVASKNRATASTAGNERSSRSHAVTKIELTGHHAEQNDTCVGKINLVDLAGSESPKTSLRMTETKNINRSLSELTNVILALLQKQDHIPYRNSKLTRLLMPSLGGNSKTLMFINVSPLQDCFAESVKSLRFATSVNSCKTGKVKRNRCRSVSTSKPI